MRTIHGMLFIALSILGLAAGAKQPAVVLVAQADNARAVADADAREQDALMTGIEAYIYGYPLVTMELTRRVSTNVAAPEARRAPMGQFAKARSYPDASYKTVTAPNADTLYTQAWIDVSKEPWIVGIPDLDGRYALFPFLDGWTTVFQVPGKRTTGTEAQTYAITGPGWSGKLPEGVTEYKSPTGMVWLLGRIYCTGTPEDYAAVHALQDEMMLVPLSRYGKPYSPAPNKIDPMIDEKAAVRDQVHAMDAGAYFKLLAELLKTNPPTPADAPMVAKLATIGIVPGQDFDLSRLDPAVAKGLARAPKPAQERIMGWFTAGISAGDNALINGWTFTTKTGVYGTNYIQRALVTAIGLGANRPQDAIYPTSEVDAEGQPYSGANRYRLHFEQGALPPAEAFWSLTLYNADYFFVANPLDRYNLSSRSPLNSNADGSVDIFIQHESPGKDKEANWLPAPTDRFVLMLRLYWPRERPPSILDGTWPVPPVTQAHTPSTGPDKH